MYDLKTVNTGVEEEKNLLKNIAFYAFIMTRTFVIFDVLWVYYEDSFIGKDD